MLNVGNHQQVELAVIFEGDSIGGQQGLSILLPRGHRPGDALDVAADLHDTTRRYEGVRLELDRWTLLGEAAWDGCEQADY